MAVHQRKTDTVYMFSSVHKRKLPSWPSTRTYKIPAYILCFVTKGEGALLVNQSICRIEPFELYLLVPGMTIETSGQAAGIEYYAVVFEPLTLHKAEESFSVAPVTVLSESLMPGRLFIRNTREVFHRILRMYEESRGKTETNGYSHRLQLEELIQTLIKDMSTQKEDGDPRINRSIAYMKKNLRDKISLENLARAAELPPVLFSRLFRLVTGTLPVDYMTRLRIDTAKRLLGEKDSRVKEVAAATGFRSEFYFSRTFHRIVGVSPSIYMKRGELRVAIASSLGFQDNLAAIGVEPVAVIDLYKYPGMDDQEYQELYDSQMEMLKQAQPSLIIGDNYHIEYRELFKPFAAHVFVEFPEWNWRVIYMTMAELVDREREAEQVLNRLDLRIADVRSTLREVWGEEKVTVIQVNHRSVGIQGTTNHPLNTLLHAELGLKPGSPVPTDDWRLELPPESLPSIETNRIFVHKHHLRAGSECVYARMVTSASWNDIAAVKNKAVFTIPNWFLMSWTPLGRHAILDALLENSQLLRPHS
ncbi:helix-turn-helix domain-containing protein [Paenibacillus paridis]|uniref:helix-turn-helix domain-containing protein n=1 Tax=Paenibacillus paridis TaxID=2583376 RepID=UPI00111EE0AB|nr:helix-turn-helix domain-containing protein [Paenibacillus paridis]